MVYIKVCFPRAFQIVEDLVGVEGNCIMQPELSLHLQPELIDVYGDKRRLKKIESKTNPVGTDKRSFRLELLKQIKVETKACQIQVE
jgi:hypothetical protein